MPPSFEHCFFDFRICFGFRISDFGFKTWPSARTFGFGLTSTKQATTIRYPRSLRNLELPAGRRLEKQVVLTRVSPEMIGVFHCLTTAMNKAETENSESPNSACPTGWQNHATPIIIQLINACYLRYPRGRASQKWSDNGPLSFYGCLRS